MASSSGGQPASRAHGGTRGAPRVALNSSGTQFLSGAVDVQEIIPAGETRSLGVPIRVPYKELYDVITGIEAGSKVPYEADMELHVDAPLLGRIGVPLDAKGEISIPRL